MPAQTSDSPGVVAPPPLLLLAALLIGFAMHRLYPLPLSPPFLLRPVGGVLVIAACSIVLSARARMLAAGTNVYPTMPTTAIVTGGPYRFTRNPMYLSLCLFNLGFGFLICDLTAAALTLALAAVLHFGVVVREERYLGRKFGGTYCAYRDRVRRWL